MTLSERRESEVTIRLEMLFALAATAAAVGNTSSPTCR